MVGARQSQHEEQKSNSESITVEELEENDVDIIMEESETQSPPKKKDVKEDFYDPMILVCSLCCHKTVIRQFIFVNVGKVHMPVTSLSVQQQ